MKEEIPFLSDIQPKKYAVLNKCAIDYIKSITKPHVVKPIRTFINNDYPIFESELSKGIMIIDDGKLKFQQEFKENESS